MKGKLVAGNSVRCTSIFVNINFNDAHYPPAPAGPPHHQVARDTVNLCSYLDQPSMTLTAAVADAAVAVAAAAAAAAAVVVVPEVQVEEVVVVAAVAANLLAQAHGPVAVAARLLNLARSALARLGGHPYVHPRVLLAVADEAYCKAQMTWSL